MLTRSDPSQETQPQILSYVLALLKLCRGGGEPASGAALDRALAQGRDVFVQFAVSGGEPGRVALQGGRPVYAAYGALPPAAALAALLALAPQSTGSLLVLSPEEGDLLFAALAGRVRHFAVPVQAASDLREVERDLFTSRFDGVVMVEYGPRIDIHLVRDGRMDSPLVNVGRLTALAWTPRALPSLPGADAGALVQAFPRPVRPGVRRSPTSDVWEAFGREVNAELGPRAERFLIRMRETHGQEHDPGRLRGHLLAELRRLRG